jgi:hypothetical protein
MEPKSLTATFKFCYPDGISDDERDTIVPSTVYKVWDWFGDHGAFIGGIPFGDNYDSNGLVDPARTPFERFAYVGPDNPLKVPFVALRLRKGATKSARLYDAMEIIMRRANLDDAENDVTIYLLGNPDDVPEPLTSLREDVLVKEMGEDKIQWWVHAALPSQASPVKRKRGDEEDKESVKKARKE